MAAKKKVVTKKTTTKKSKVETAKKPVKKVVVQSQSVKSNHKPVVISTAKVDTSTPVNKWIGSDFNSMLDDMNLEPYEYCESMHKVNPLEHKMFDVLKVEEPTLKVPLWFRILFWFVK